jgi:pimeloyl-ACP methyl ester carboxylesterase
MGARSQESAMPSPTLLAQFPTAHVATAHGRVAHRQSTSPGYAGAVTHVLLHGIGSGSASWLAQLQQAGRCAAASVLAWDAPGYGDSDALPMASPVANDYALRFWAWLDACSVEPHQPFTLVGHSLGALVAAAAVVQQPARVARLVLLAPAQGYARADAATRQRKLEDRLAHLALWGPAGMARRRAGAMLSPHASPALLQFVEQVMAGIDPRGYTQAARMLSTGDVAADLVQVRCPVVVGSGSADAVTPPQGCRALAQLAGAPYVDLGDAGHSCALEAAPEVNRLIGLAGDTP